MSAATSLHEDFTGDDLRRLAKASRDAGQSRRLLALSEKYGRYGYRKIGALKAAGWFVVLAACFPAMLANERA